MCVSLAGKLFALNPKVIPIMPCAWTALRVECPTPKLKLATAMMNLQHGLGDICENL